MLSRRGPVRIVASPTLDERVLGVSMNRHKPFLHILMAVKTTTFEAKPPAPT